MRILVIEHRCRCAQSEACGTGEGGKDISTILMFVLSMTESSVGTFLHLHFIGL